MGIPPIKRRLRRTLREISWNLGLTLAPTLLDILRRQPLERLHALARGVGSFWFHAIGSSRKLGMDNLDLVFGASISRDEKACFCRESFKNILLCVMDYYHYSFRTDEYRDKVVIDPVSERRLRDLLEKGKGGLIFSAHLGNWELLASFLTQYAATSVLARQQKGFEPYVVACRDRHNVHTLPDNSTLPRDIISRLRRGELVGFALDRNLRHTKGIMVDFLGRPAYTLYTPVLLAMKSKAPVAGAFMVKEGSGYRLFIEEPGEVKPLETREETYRHYTQTLMDILGKYVRQYPDQWFWAHKRWGKPKGKVAF
jgi:Kdo2-lipid IVA lauroyltransferase/acyltransferase